MPRSTTVKTAISIPREEYELIEAIRKKAGKTRSSILVEALHSWLATRRKQELDQSYEAGYRRKPENLAEVKAFFKATAPVWGKEQW